MNFEDLLKHEAITEDELLPRTVRLIVKYRAIEPSPEETVVQEIDDLNNLIVNEIMMVVADKRAKTEAEAELAKKTEEATQAEKDALEKQKKIDNRTLMGRLSDRYKPVKN